MLTHEDVVAARALEGSASEVEGRGEEAGHERVPLWVGLDVGANRDAGASFAT